MHNPYRGGTADVWYSLKGADFWIEYKWIDRVPKRGRVVPKLEPLQLGWLTKRKAEGRNVSVVVGYPKGAVLFASPQSWRDGLTAAQFAKQTITKRALAEWIAS